MQFIFFRDNENGSGMHPNKHYCFFQSFMLGNPLLAVSPLRMAVLLRQQESHSLSNDFQHSPPLPAQCLPSTFWDPLWPRAMNFLACYLCLSRSPIWYLAHNCWQILLQGMCPFSSLPRVWCGEALFQLPPFNNYQNNVSCALNGGAWFIQMWWQMLASWSSASFTVIWWQWGQLTYSVSSNNEKYLETEQN